MPTGSVVVVVWAIPPVTVTGAPMSVVPASNCTVPATVGLTVAFRVTEVPANWGLAGVAVSEVVVGMAVIVYEAVPVEPPKPLPAVGEKTALSGRCRPGGVAVVVWAIPPVTVTGVPMSVVPTSNCTVPVAVGVTVAFRVTEVPNTWGLAGVAVSTVVVGAAVIV